MNKVILMGRLTRDAEVKYAQNGNGSAVGRFSLAVDRRFKREGDEQTADFINCVAFGKTAEFLERFGKKGVKFAVEGRIQTGSYVNKEGQRVYTTDVVVESMEFAESRQNNPAGGNGQPQNQSYNQQPNYNQAPPQNQGYNYQQPPQAPVDDFGFGSIDSELPFN